MSQGQKFPAGISGNFLILGAGYLEFIQAYWNCERSLS